MEVFFFGPTSSQLLGIYHPASSERDRYQGIVMCYPFGQEYMRAHRAFRQLANTLADNGYHVLRFDYRGTGDSAGELQDVSASDWVEDIGFAVQELKDMAGVYGISLLGLRLGALLAGVAAADRRDLNRLVVWDPVVSGRSHIRELMDKVKSVVPHKRQSNFVDRQGNLHFNGFPLSPAMQRSLGELDLRQTTPGADQILQIASHENEEFESLADRWSELEGFEYRHTPAEHDWNYVDHVGGILLPQPVLREISGWM
ncbi:alpha/beta fold hydrolase [Proteobacteria bacterium 005FR1]|nr:alpha/beta fold hydrolase [Proteobacteria bacterium 005FR1]